MPNESFIAKHKTSLKMEGTDNSLQTTLSKYWSDEILKLEILKVLLNLHDSALEKIKEFGLPPWFLPASLIFTICLSVTLIIKCCCSARVVVRKSSEKVKAAKEFIAPSEGPRFRKRDKIAFMGRRVFRNAKAVGSMIKGGQGRKRKAVAKLVRRIVGDKSTPPTGSRDYGREEGRADLPDAYLKEDEVGEEQNLPLALLLVLKNMRVFGQFDNKIFVELMKSIEYINLRPNNHLFRVGDPDENMYIVESGRLNVYSNPSGIQAGELELNSQQLLKTIGKGEAILSLLSFLESLGGKHESFKTISAKATEETRVIKFAFQSFKSAFEKYPEDLTKVVQVVMIRLQRVTLLALHQYLGLGAELLTEQHRGTRSRSRTTSMNVGSAMSTNSGSTLSPPVIEQQSIPASICASPYFKAPAKLIELDYKQLQKIAVEVFMELLDIEEEDLKDQRLEGIRMEDYINVASWEDGDVLVEEEMDDSANLLLILQGSVVLTQASTEDTDDHSNPCQIEIHRAYPGGVLGQLQCLTGEPSFFTIKAVDEGKNQTTKVASLDARFIQKCMKLYPKVALKLARSCVDQLSPYVRSIDFALEWLQLESGRALYKQGQTADSTYVVLSGRLRSVIKKGEKRELVGEYARGDLTGIVETLMKTPRSTTVIAVRDTEVAKIPAGLIDAIKIRYPVVMLRLIKLLGQKVQQSWERGSPGSSMGPTGIPSSDPTHGNVTRMGIAQSNFSTVALLPLSSDIPISAFGFELLHALTQIDPAIRLTKEYVEEELGEAAFDKSNDFRLHEWLASQEDKNRIVLYQCDPELTEWTRLSIRHADVIFILTNPKGNPTLSHFERSLEDLSRRTRKEMIFLHHEDTRYPKGTANWLRDRGWINTHYHVKCPRRMFSKKTKYSKIMQGPPPDVNSDFSRLARGVTGQTVGLVLGGGGARGCSHIGIIKSILEAGIPIDTVAGVSIGSFIGGLYARERDVTEVTVKAREFSNKISQVWRWVLDFCYPYTSYFTGFNFNLVIEQALGSDSDILDNWLPYFTITTDITSSCQRIHDYGSLWRYVRASMSLAGWLPPICDPIDQHLLLDGGYANNLPADIMRLRGAKHILAVDVGAEDNTNFSEYGDTLSGFHILFSKLNPWSKPLNVPNQAEVQLRLAYVSCVDKLESVKNSGYCEYIRPPIEKYGTLQFQVRIGQFIITIYLISKKKYNQVSYLID